ncbi:DUF6541 family protein [Microbacterium paludicola]|uniref:DUF6541 family protein n=1 Tax=Microbacterium paludicola TaxID=300019 RepID=UPI0011A3131B|nr:DUF6541 family protein [Microbacterium paludicola]
MTAGWLGQSLVVLASVGMLFIPGMLALTCVGLRGLARLAAAPVYTVFATSVSALLFGFLRIPWSPVSWLVAMLIMLGIAWGAGRLIKLDPSPEVEGRRRRALMGAVIFGAVFTAWRLVTYIGEVDAISQTNDAVFHMNAVRFILETANASSLHVSAVVGSPGFYPAAWHALVSLIVTMTGASITVAANVLTLMIGVVWVLGVTWLAVIASGSAAVGAYAAVLAGAMQNFPLLMVQWGVLFPNALSTALIPASIALVLVFAERAGISYDWRSLLRWVLVLGVIVGALALSQPAALLPWAAICAVWLTLREAMRPGSRRQLWYRAVFVLVGWLLLALAWVLLAGNTSGSHWPFFRSREEALLDVVVNGQVLIPPQIGISVLMLVGLGVALRRRSLWWMAVSWLGLAGLYWLVAAVGNEKVRDIVLGPWYADPYRLAALAPIAVVPLAAVGVDAIMRRVPFRRDVSGDRVRMSIGLGVLAIGVLLVGLLRPVPLPSITAGTYEEVSRYEASARAYLNPDERRLLETLGDLVEPGSRVIANPSTGAGFGYFFSGVDVFPRNWAPPSDAAWQTIASDLNEAAADPAVCEALAQYGEPEYVLDFGPGENRSGRWVMPGMTDFVGRDGFALIDRVGEASLWRITACDG